MDGIVGLPPLVALNTPPIRTPAQHNTEQKNSSFMGPTVFSLSFSLVMSNFSDRYRKLFRRSFLEHYVVLGLCLSFPLDRVFPPPSPRLRPPPSSCLYWFSVSSYSHSCPCVPVLVIVPVISPLPFSSPMLLPSPPPPHPPFMSASFFFFFSLLSPSKKNQKKEKGQHEKRKQIYIYIYTTSVFVVFVL